MMFLRDEMVPGDLAGWRYGFDDDADWHCNTGCTTDDISLFLFGA